MEASASSSNRLEVASVAGVAAPEGGGEGGEGGVSVDRRSDSSSAVLSRAARRASASWALPAGVVVVAMVTESQAMRGGAHGVQ